MHWIEISVVSNERCDAASVEDTHVQGMRNVRKREHSDGDSRRSTVHARGARIKRARERGVRAPLADTLRRTSVEKSTYVRVIFPSVLCNIIAKSSYLEKRGQRKAQPTARCRTSARDREREDEQLLRTRCRGSLKSSTVIRVSIACMRESVCDNSASHEWCHSVPAGKEVRVFGGKPSQHRRCAAVARSACANKPIPEQANANHPSGSEFFWPGNCACVYLLVWRLKIIRRGEGFFIWRCACIEKNKARASSVTASLARQITAQSHRQKQCRHRQW